MATDKKKEVKMKDLKPAKDAKGGVARQQNTSGHSMNRTGGSQQNATKGGNMNSTGGRSLL
jgi:hypothetical protein